MGRLLRKGKLSEADLEATLGRLEAGTDLEALSTAEFVIEVGWGRRQGVVLGGREGAMLSRTLGIAGSYWLHCTVLTEANLPLGGATVPAAHIAGGA